MSLFEGINIKSIIYGAIISVICIILGHEVNDLFYPFIAVGLLYAGYSSTGIKQGMLAGCIAAIPIAILTIFGFLGALKGFLATMAGNITLIIIMLLLGVFIGFIGAWTKRDRVKALEEYNNKNSKGKKKNKKKK